MILKLKDWDGVQKGVIINAKMEDVCAKMRDKADLIFTSPPYGVDGVLTVPSKGRAAAGVDKAKAMKYDSVKDTFLEADYVRWLTAARNASHLTFWNVPAKQYDRAFGVDLREPVGQIIWAKSNGTVPFDRKGVIYSHEYIWMFGDHKRIVKPFNSVWSFPTQRLSKHPAPFSPELAAKAISHCTKAGDVVFDPFGGSGTTAAVAKALGRKWITCDVSEEYCKWIQERLEKTRTM